MPIENDNGHIAIIGQYSVQILRLRAIQSAMSLKLKSGMETTRGVRIFPLVKREFGLKGNNERVYQQFLEMLPRMIDRLQLMDTLATEAKAARARGDVATAETHESELAALERGE